MGRGTGAGTRQFHYTLEQLHDDEAPGLAADAIAPLVCWLDRGSDAGTRTFERPDPEAPGEATCELVLSWDIGPLVRRDPRLGEELRRCRHVRAFAGRDRSAEAALGLDVVATACLSGRRVPAIRLFRPPSLPVHAEPPAGARGVLLREAAALKLRAQRLRAVGDADERWEATALLRDAAAKELAALEAWKSDPETARVPPAGEVEARLEACHLYLLARDPLRALDVWSSLPQEAFSAGAGEPPANTVQPLLGAAASGLARALDEALGAGPPSMSDLRPDQVRALLDEHPGVGELWWALARCTKSPGEVDLARGRALRLLPHLHDDAAAQAAFHGMEAALAPKLAVALSAPRGGDLGVEAVSRILIVFCALLSSFAETTAGAPVSPVLSGAPAVDPATGTLTLRFSARGLHPFALGELDGDLGEGLGRRDARAEVALLSLLDEHRLTLSAWTATQPHQPGLSIDEPRRKALLPAASAAALRTLDTRDVPQADDIERVLRAVGRLAGGADHQLDLSPRQISYYRRAAKLLGLLTEDEEPTPAGQLIARLPAKDRLRVAVVHFESSRCGDAWVRWSGGRTLLDVDPKSAADFLKASVPGLSKDTADRRAQTLAAWHRALLPHHYKVR